MRTFFRITYGGFLKSKIQKKGGKDTENMSHAKWNKKSIKPLKNELKTYRNNGVQLYLNGEPSTPKNIARACIIAEGGGYMRDYTEDEKGRIVTVNFDLINEIPATYKKHE